MDYKVKGQVVGTVNVGKVGVDRIIVRDASTTENEKVESSEPIDDLIFIHFANGDGADLVSTLCVSWIKREDHNIDIERGAEFPQDAFENRLISEIHSAIRSRNCDPVFHCNYLLLPRVIPAHK